VLIVPRAHNYRSRLFFPRYPSIPFQA